LAPAGLDVGINTFYAAKYGIFTCHDIVQRITLGDVKYDEGLI